MARLLKLDQLSNESKRLLESTLTCYPKSKYNSKKKTEFYVKEGQYMRVPFMTGRIPGLQNNIKGLEECVVTDHSQVAPIDINFIGDLYDNKKSIIEEANPILDRTGALLLNVGTGVGKTVISMYYLARLKVVTLILVHSTTVLVQWPNAASKFLDLQEGEIAILKSNISKKKSTITENTKVVVALHGSVNKIPDWFKSRVGLVIVDEFHLALNATGLKSMLTVTPQYFIGVTATLERTDGAHEKNIYFFGRDKVYRPLPSNYEIIRVNTHLVADRPQIRMRGGKSKLDYAAYQAGLMRCERRNKIIVKLATYIKSRPLMILAERVEHVETLYNMLRAEGMEVDTLCEKKSNYNACDILVGTTQKIGVGFDEANFCENFVSRSSDLILTFTIKDESRLIQAVGRVSRGDKPRVFQIIDNDRTSLSHWEENQPIYKRFGWKVTAIKFTPSASSN